jgi:hypothetical protein
LKKENTASGSCAKGELMGSSEREDNIGELCSIATDISNRDPAKLHQRVLTSSELTPSH